MSDKEKGSERASPYSGADASATRLGDSFDMQNGGDAAAERARGDVFADPHVSGTGASSSEFIEVDLENTYGYGDRRYGPGRNVKVPLSLAQSLGLADGEGNRLFPFDTPESRAARARGAAAAAAASRGRVDESSRDVSKEGGAARKAAGDSPHFVTRGTSTAPAGGGSGAQPNFVPADAHDEGLPPGTKTPPQSTQRIVVEVQSGGQVSAHTEGGAQGSNAASGTTSSTGAGAASGQQGGASGEADESGTVSGLSREELEDLPVDELREHAERLALDVKRSDGEEGRPLKADYVKALSRKAKR